MTLLEDVHKMQQQMEAVTELAEANRSLIEKHEEQVNGQRGLSQAVDNLSATIEKVSRDMKADVAGLRRAAYWVGGLIIAGSITFAFSALSIFA